jgi:AcrR family transcriptional regulator
MVNRPTGRRAGPNTTRTAILSAARQEFSQRGFETATVRAIASAAGVDPALILHYFGSKRGVFVAAVELPFEPPALVRVLEGPEEELGERLVTFFLAAWDPAGSRPTLLALMRSAASDPQAAETLRERLTAEILMPIISRVGASAPEWRASLAAAHLAGLGMARFVLGVEPLASAPVPLVVKAVGPAIQRYLTDEIPFEEEPDHA